MPAQDKASNVKLPGIHEMLSDDLFQLSKPIFTSAHSPTLLSRGVTESTLGIRVDRRTVMLPPLVTQQYHRHPQPALDVAYRDHRSSPPPGSHLSLSTSTSPLVLPDPMRSPVDRHRLSSSTLPTTCLHKQDGREQEKKHACELCGRAFNRPSSLAIHKNIHTGEQPFACPFLGCGRRFNVNSNMRRHFRNHTSASRQMAMSPYTYPLTTSPRALPTAAHNQSKRSRQGTAPSSRSRAWTVSAIYSSSQSSSQYSDSEDDSESSFRLRPSSSFDFDAEVMEASERVNRLRLRSHSSPGMRPAAHVPARVDEEEELRLLSTSVCDVPGCHCTAATETRALDS